MGLLALGPSQYLAQNLSTEDQIEMDSGLQSMESVNRPLTNLVLVHCLCLSLCICSGFTEIFTE